MSPPFSPFPPLETRAGRQPRAPPSNRRPLWISCGRVSCLMTTMRYCQGLINLWWARLAQRKSCSSCYATLSPLMLETRLVLSSFFFSFPFSFGCFAFFSSHAVYDICQQPRKGPLYQLASRLDVNLPTWGQISRGIVFSSLKLLLGHNSPTLVPGRST